jgi:putative FmdB family regulatory protein
MPIYEYACTDCGNQFEQLVRMGAENPPCPSCGEPHVQKKLSAFSPLSGGQPEPMACESPCGACGNPFGSCGAGMQ